MENWFISFFSFWNIWHGNYIFFSLVRSEKMEKYVLDLYTQKMCQKHKQAKALESENKVGWVFPQQKWIFFHLFSSLLFFSLLSLSLSLLHTHLHSHYLYFSWFTKKLCDYRFYEKNILRWKCNKKALFLSLPRR